MNAAPASARTTLHYEDLDVGQTFRTATVEITAEEIVAFAGRYDPQPFHLDETSGRASVFGGLVASGWLTASLTMRLIIEGELRIANGLVGLGMESVRWPRPVRPGDRLAAESEITSLRVSISRPDHGIAKVRTTTTNQHGEVVQILTAIQLVRRRPNPALHNE